MKIILMRRIIALISLFLSAYQDVVFAADTSTPIVVHLDKISMGSSLNLFLQEHTNAFTMPGIAANSNRSAVQQIFVEINTKLAEQAAYIFLSNTLSGVSFASFPTNSQGTMFDSLMKDASRLWGQPERRAERVLLGSGVTIVTNDVFFWKKADRHSFLYSTLKYVNFVTIDPARLNLSEFLPDENTITQLKAIETKREKTIK